MATKYETGQNPLWDLQQPHISDTFKYAKDEFAKGAPAYYPGETVAGYDPVRAAGANLGILGAGDQAKLSDAYTQGLLGILGGNDPAGQRLATQAATAAGNPFSSTFGGARHAKAASGAAADVLAGRQFDAFSKIRDAQSAAAQPGATLGNIGKDFQDQRQREIDAAKAKYDYEANAPANWIRQYQGLIGFPGAASAPTNTTTTSPSNIHTKASNWANTIGNIGSIASGLGSLFGFAEGGMVPNSQPLNYTPDELYNALQEDIDYVAEMIKGGASVADVANEYINAWNLAPTDTTYETIGMVYDELKGLVDQPQMRQPMGSMGSRYDRVKMKKMQSRGM